LASGLLPICFGQATKVSSYLLDADKRYHVRGKLGFNTTTGDSEGDVTEERPVGDYGPVQIETALEPLRGNILQIPPMYSALKHKGKRLYELAREGIEVEREPRPISIHELRLVSCENGEIELIVRCTKGTYVRTLVEDIGNALGCGAHVIWLRRTGVGAYSADDSLTIPDLEALAEPGHSVLDEQLLPIETALDHWPPVRLSDDAAFYIKQGQPVVVPHAPTRGWVRLYTKSEHFMGIGQIQDDGKVAPKRMLSA
jgi:tRNA pseudouridine55 synthase